MLQNTGKIEHEGIISSIDNNYIYVKIMQTSACAECHAKTMCSLSEAKEKVIEIPNSQSNYRVGDAVTITGAPSLGLMAVFYAFVLPLILLLSVLVVVLWLSDSEISAILFSLVSLLVYYIVLYFYRDIMKKKFVFTLTKKL